MAKEERELSIEYLEKIKEDYIEGNAYERHPLPEYYAIENAIKALKQEPKWIPVTERLPEEGQMIIACYPTDCGKRVRTAYYYNKECGFSCGITYAWMPLPEPYKGGQEDGKA